MSRRIELTYGSLSTRDWSYRSTGDKYPQEPFTAPEHLVYSIHTHTFKAILFKPCAKLIEILCNTYHFSKRLRNAPRTGLEPSRRIGIPLNPLTGFYGPVWGHESGIDELPKPLTNLLP